MTRRHRKDSQHLDAAEHLRVLREHLARGSEISDPPM
jgi:hypothetical protein